MVKVAAGKIIDAHSHVWTSDTDQYPLASAFGKSDLWLPSFTPEDHFIYSRLVGDVRINLVQMTWYGLDHRYIIDIIAGDPDRYVGTGIVSAVSDVELGSPDKAMVTLSNHGIYAFRVRGGRNARMYLGDWPRWLDHDGYHKMFKTGADHNLAISFLVGPHDIPELDRMCALYPDTPVIIDHFGGIQKVDGGFNDDHLSSLCLMSVHKKVMLKIGPIHKYDFTDVLPLLRRVVASFGPERCMWESNSGGPAPFLNPETDYLESVEVIREHADFLSESDKEQILFGTAENFFFDR